MELLVAMLIFCCVCASWPTIFQVQSANRESYRREAVERLAGMMDVVSRQDGLLQNFKYGRSLHFEGGMLISEQGNGKVVRNMFDERDSTIGYRLRIKRFSEVKQLGWVAPESKSDSKGELEEGCLKDASPVLVGELFERSGTLAKEDFKDEEEMNLGGRIWRATVVLRVTN